MRRMKTNNILILAAISLFLLLSGNAYAGGTWQLENNWYHIDGTWLVTPNPVVILNENRQDGLFSKQFTGVAPNETSAFDANISYKLNWVPDLSTPNILPFKWLWIQEYGWSKALWWSYANQLTAQCNATSELGGVSTNGYTSNPPDPSTTKWCQIESIDELSWKRVDSRSGSIQRTVHFTSGVTDVSSTDGGMAYSSAKLNVIELSYVKRATIASPHNTTSNTLNIPITINPIMGGTNGGGDPVDIATGLHVYLPAPDITVYNPYGPSVMFQRNCNSGLSREGKYSPGLACGWVHNYDITITSSNSILTLKYPNSYEEVINPANNTAPAGVPYRVTGVASSEPGQWESITLTFTDQTQWVFTLADNRTDLYLLKRIVNRIGRYVTLNYGFDYLDDPTAKVFHVTSIDADQDITPGDRTLLTIDYNGRITNIHDIYERGVGYQYESETLKSVSMIGSGTDHWRYGYYREIASGVETPSPFYEPHLNNIKFLSPPGTYSEQTITYQDFPIHAVGASIPQVLMDPKVIKFTDANSNRTEYEYHPDDNYTKVKTYDKHNVLAKEVDIKYEAAPDGSYRVTGEKDAKGNSTSISYSGTCPYKPTSITDKNGNTTQITYDQYGHMTSITRPRGTTTTYTYDYSAFPLGRLVSIQEEGKPATTITYYEPTGLVNTITSPSPTGTGTVQSSYTYDALGNRLTATVPDSNGNSVTITYNYTTDGTYTQDAKIGQPLTVTDSLGRTTHYRYDARGNVKSVTDDAGNETTIDYNIADQPTKMILPPEIKQ